MHSLNTFKNKRKRILTIKALISISASRVCVIYEDTFNRKELVQYWPKSEITYSSIQIKHNF